MSARRSSHRVWKTALAIYTAAFFCMLYGPLVIIGILSFNDSEVVGLPLRGWTTQWYERVAETPALMTSLFNSIAVGVFSALGATVLALTLSLAFRRGLVGQKVIFQLILMPIILPGIVGGIVLLIFFGYLGVRSSLYTTVLVAHINWVLPFAFLTLYPRVLGLDRSLEEAAMDLGAKPIMVFRRVVFPILMPAMAATALFSFSLSFDEFVRTLFVTGFDRTIPVAFWSLIVDDLAPELPAMAVCVVAISIVVSSLGFFLSRKSTGNQQ